MKTTCLAWLGLIGLWLMACTGSPAATPPSTISPTATITATSAAILSPTPLPAATSSSTLTSLPPTSPPLNLTGDQPGDTPPSATPTPVPPTSPPAQATNTPTHIPPTSPTAQSSPIPPPTPPPVSPTPVLTQGSWRLGQFMNAPARSEMPAVRLGDWVYAPGGFGGESRLEGYNPETDQWQPLAEMPAGRHHLMAAAYVDKIYVFGGAQAQSWTPTDTVWQYDPATNGWSEPGVMPETRLAGAAVTLGDKIYVVGGVGGGETLLEFMPEGGSWRLLPGPFQPREHVSAVALHDELWVLGGRWPGVGELATVEIYNPAANNWRDGPSMNVARAGFATAVVQEHLMVAGGEVILNGQETLASFEILAPDHSAWQPGPDLLTPIHGVGGAAFQGHFLLLGGSIRAGAIENEGQVQIYEPF